MGFFTIFLLALAIVFILKGIIIVQQAEVVVIEKLGKFEGKMGQFYMLRAWDKFPLLSRPISIHDIDENSISFLYKVVGEGTQILSKVKVNETVCKEYPYKI